MYDSLWAIMAHLQSILFYYLYFYHYTCCYISTPSISHSVTFSPCVCTMTHHPSMIEICNYLRDTASTVAFCRRHTLLRESMVCAKCDKDMTIIQRSAKHCRDGEAWRCASCKSTRSIREGSIWLVCFMLYL